MAYISEKRFESFCPSVDVTGEGQRGKIRKEKESLSHASKSLALYSPTAGSRPRQEREEMYG